MDWVLYYGKNGSQLFYKKKKKSNPTIQYPPLFVGIKKKKIYIYIYIYRHHHNFLGTLQVKSFKSFIVNFASNFLISSGIFLSILCNFPPLNFCIIS